jgi:serine protease AprX
MAGNNDDRVPDQLALIEQALVERGAVAIDQIAKELNLEPKEVSKLIDQLGKLRPLTVRGSGKRLSYELAAETGGGGSGIGGTPPPVSKGSGSSSGDDDEEAPDYRGFNPRDLDRMVISLPLREMLDDLAQGRVKEVAEKFNIHEGRISIIIDLNLGYPGGLTRARQRVFDLLVEIGSSGRALDASLKKPLLDQVSPPTTREASGQYVFAWLSPDDIRRLVVTDRSRSRNGKGAIYRIWPDNLVRLSSSLGPLATIKADAASATFSCSGDGIVWAVLDSGIDGTHPHFEAHGNLEGLPPGIVHMDFTRPDHPEPLVDKLMHGTHVAGIIAGQMKPTGGQSLYASAYERDENGKKQEMRIQLTEVSGVAPRCKLVSYKVVGDNRAGPVTGVMAALEEINRANGYGKLIRIHGVNMSLGYPFEARWFACGHSPLCEVVDRLVRSGVVVVAAAGNNGYGQVELGNGSWGQGLPMSITDPGNADRAITVGSTHRDSPHTFGVSFFSSKGPTGDGRNKPDLLAPGERIISCAARGPAAPDDAPLYREDSGTSMAAPHVSGAIAAFLSVRKEFIGNSEAVKDVFLKSALDLKRNNYMQGYGLLDLLRALQSV